MRDLLLIGGGGHASSCLDVIRIEAKWQVVRLIEKENYAGPLINENLIIGGDHDLDAFVHRTRAVHVSLGHIKSFHLRESFCLKAAELGAYFPVIRSPLAHVSEDSHLGDGTIVMHGSLVNFGLQSVITAS